ncbi:MAG: peptidoglycan DD-metalloendopeptidase family protein [Clostridiales bacterium]|nr:peptidoglycan DD-metalloendopeptidase family protein [Clostridiales bacterium]
MSKMVLKGKKRKAVALITAVSFALPAFALTQKPFVYAAPDYLNLVELERASEEDLEETRRERDEAMARAQAAAARVSELRDQVDQVTGQINELQELETERQGEYQLLQSQYAAACLAKAEALERYVEAQENLEATELMFQERLSVMFEFQNKSYLEILLDSDSLAGFFTNIEIISLIADSDKQAVESMEEALDLARLASEYALQEAELAEQAADDKLAEIEEIEEEIGIQSATINDLNAQLSEAEQTAGQFNSTVSSLNAQIEQMQNEIISQYNIAAETNPAPQVIDDPTDTHVDETTSETQETQTTETSEQTGETQTETQQSDTVPSDNGDTEETAFEISSEPTSTPTPVPLPTTAPASSTTGQLQWPTWSRSVGSEFGYRIHPIYQDRRFHSGIDIEDGFGDTICAAASGTVSYVEYPCPNSNTGGSGYGNYLIIDHGNGLYTLYAHCQSITVNSGDYVSCGQAIGTVGSTGGSTGPHLHFEVRTGGPWGTAVDPRAYLVR